MEPIIDVKGLTVRRGNADAISDATFAIYHDDDGTTYSEATAIVFGATCPANGVIDFGFEAAGGGITIAPGGSLGVKTGTANAITFSVYGVTQ